MVTLIHWLYLTISPINPTDEPVDPLAGRATIRRRTKPDVTLKAQLDWQSTESRNRSVLSGSAPLSRAIATVRERDARACGYEPRMGDVVTAIVTRDGSVEPTRLYVADANKRGEWPSRYSTWLLRLTDEAPARQVR